MNDENITGEEEFVNPNINNVPNQASNRQASNRINRVLNSPRVNPYFAQHGDSLPASKRTDGLHGIGPNKNNSDDSSSPSSLLSKLNKSNNNNNISKNSDSLKKSGIDKVKEKGAQAAMSAAGVPPKAAEAITKVAQNRRNNNGIAAKTSPIGGLLDIFGKSTDDKTSTKESLELGGVANVKISFWMKASLGVFGGLFFLVIAFVCLFSASQTYLNAKKIHQSYNANKMEDYINNKMTDEEKSEELTDDDINGIDELEFYDNSSSNLVTVAKTTDFDISEINDFYSDVENYDNVKESTVYNFFLKLNYISKYYKQNYNVTLDLPLIMSTILVESEDMKVIFEKNTKGFNYRKCIKNNSGTLDFSKCYTDKFSYAKKWFKYDSKYLNKYKITQKSSAHDIEILAKNMVSMSVTENCVDSSNNVVSSNVLKDDEIGTQVLECEEGQTYQTTSSIAKLDLEKYDEFLKEFLEKKYYLNKDSDSSDEDGDEEIYYDNGISVASNFTKYTFDGDLLEQLASVCYREQESVKGAAAEASLMANLFEKNGESYQNKYGKTGLGLYHYVLESGWFGNPSSTMSAKSAPSDVVSAVRSVLVDGKRTLPRYVDEHDCWDCNSGDRCSDGKRGDICTLSTDGKSLTSMSDIKNRTNYIRNQTLIKSVYGANYTFYSFPTDNSDPFGYLSEKLRQTYGDCYYDFDTGKAVNCGASFVSTFLSWLKSIAQDDSHGYSQLHRESLIDYDCSSFIYYGLINSGFNKEQLGTPAFTTSNQREVLKKNGFEELKFADLVPDGSTTTKLEPGDILWTSGHTEVYMGEGINVGAHQSENNSTTGEYGDQTGKEISIGQFWNDNWQYVYRYRG